MIHIRLKNEFKRLGITATAAAKSIGDADSQGLRDVLGGRKRLTAEMLGALQATGVNVLYVLFGDSTPPPPEVLSTHERYLLERYRASPAPLRDAALRVLLGGDPPASRRGQTVIHGTVGQSMGDNHAPMTINMDMGNKKK